MATDQRSGKDRRDGWGETKCVFCDSIQAATDDHRKLVCRTIIAGDKANMEKINSIDSAHKEKLSDMKKIFAFCALVALGFAGWIALDHFGLSKTVAANTEIIKHTIKNQEVLNSNLSQVMFHMNLEPKALPPAKVEKK